MDTLTVASSGIHIQIIADTSGVMSAFNVLLDKLSHGGMAIWLNHFIYPYLKERAQSRFLNEGDDAAGKWLPLTEATISFRDSGGFGPGPINKRTGELEAFIVGANASIFPTPIGTQMNYPGEVPVGILGTKVQTAQMGKDSPSTPARPVVALGLQDLNWTLQSLALYIQAGDTI